MHEQLHNYVATYTGEDTGRDREVALALKWAASQVGAASDILVIAPTKTSFRDNPVLAQLPPSVRKETMRTLTGASGAKAVVACWPTPDDLDKIDSFRSMQYLCVVPWVPGEIDVWRAARTATSLANDTPSAGLPALDPVVHAAIASITRRVNVSTGIGHPSDKNAAISAFRILQKHGYSWSPESVQATAMALGWNGTDAKDLADVARKVTDRHRFRSVSNTWANNIIDQWRDSVM